MLYLSRFSREAELCVCMRTSGKTVCWRNQEESVSQMNPEVCAGELPFAQERLATFFYLQAVSWLDETTLIIEGSLLSQFF